MPIFVPTPNHDHVVDNSRVNAGAIWWEVRPVLVMQQSDWPAADGSSGITSSKIMDDVEAAGRAIEVGSNFFLFFSSQLSSGTAMNTMPGMPGMKMAPPSSTSITMRSDSKAALRQRSGE
jgi:hypothetical protein